MLLAFIVGFHRNGTPWSWARQRCCLIALGVCYRYVEGIITDSHVVYLANVPMQCASSPLHLGTGASVRTWDNSDCGAPDKVAAGHSSKLSRVRSAVHHYAHIMR